MNEAVNHFRSKLSFETDAWDLNEMVRAGANVVIVDARSEANYAQEHIPHAINFPHRRMNADSTKDLDRDTLYVTYCDGIGCNGSTKGALEARRAGLSGEGIDWRN